MFGTLEGRKSEGGASSSMDRGSSKKEWQALVEVSVLQVGCFGVEVVVVDGWV